MTKSGKKPDIKEAQLWCECNCANCEIGAHERCNSPKCHMPSGRTSKQTAQTRPLAEVFLGKLAKLEFELFW